MQPHNYLEGSTLVAFGGEIVSQMVRSKLQVATL